MEKVFDVPEISFTDIQSENIRDSNIELRVARLDLIHPIVSGNKLFKLHFFLKDAMAKGFGSIITYGGAYSNHLVATAYACRQLGLKSIGIVRGEAPENISHTLTQCRQYGMELRFVSRGAYKSSAPEALAEQKQHYVIPEGGYHPIGARGASLIMSSLKKEHATHLCTAVGTATTLAGLCIGKNQEKVIGIPVLKSLEDINDRLAFLAPSIQSDFSMWNEYHFGGYAKKSEELISFMNHIFKAHGLATDFVYTAKMMFAVLEKIDSGYFPKGSKVICLHTGGLQGNHSLPAGTLVF